jgi:hypothetical protein
VAIIRKEFKKREEVRILRAMGRNISKQIKNYPKVITSGPYQKIAQILNVLKPFILNMT